MGDDVEQLKNQVQKRPDRLDLLSEDPKDPASIVRISDDLRDVLLLGAEIVSSANGEVYRIVGEGQMAQVGDLLAGVQRSPGGTIEKHILFTEVGDGASRLFTAVVGLRVVSIVVGRVDAARIQADLDTIGKQLDELQARAHRDDRTAVERAVRTLKRVTSHNEDGVADHTDVTDLRKSLDEVASVFGHAQDRHTSAVEAVKQHTTNEKEQIKDANRRQMEQLREALEGLDPRTLPISGSGLSELQAAIDLLESQVGASSDENDGSRHRGAVSRARQKLDEFSAVFSSGPKNEDIKAVRDALEEMLIASAVAHELAALMLRLESPERRRAKTGEVSAVLGPQREALIEIDAWRADASRFSTLVDSEAWTELEDVSGLAMELSRLARAEAEGTLAVRVQRDGPAELIEIVA